MTRVGAFSLAAVGPALLAMLAGGCATRAREDTVSLVCVGDIMLGRGVRRACEKRGNHYPLGEVRDLLRAADVTLGNLESPLPDVPVRFPRVNGLIGPPEMAPVLADAGFDVLSLANNHAVDAGRRGLERTSELLVGAGISAVGCGPTLADAKRGVVLTRRGVRIGFAALNHVPAVGFVHDPQRESVVGLSREVLQETISQLAPRCDVVVVSFHWGKEGSREVSDYERGLAHLAADLGAKLVIGHHAHVRGECEEYRGALIAYCLGNLVFDAQSYGGNEGYILSCGLSRAGVVDYTLLPTRVVECQARVEQGAALQ